MLENTLTIRKAPTGIQGLDDIIGGGLPAGRTTLVCGGPGSGKTLLATEFLARGALEFDEPGVFMAFEETEANLIQNVASLNIDLPSLIEQKKIAIDYVFIERSEIEETGEYGLEGLFIRLASAIDAIGAKRVVLDTIEAIFAGFDNESILRAEIRRLFRWLSDKGVTAIVTGERGEKTLTRYGLEEYVSDCVILLDNRLENKISNRILRVVKYRGTGHSTNEHPFLISDQGLWIEPITTLGLNYQVSNEHIPSGLPELDRMLDNKGFYRGSSILISGAPGTGKSSLAATLVDAACRRGERCLLMSFEESPDQIIRNMRSIGIDLERWVRQGLLRIDANRPWYYGLEMHLLTLQKMTQEFKPSIVVIDPLTDLTGIGSTTEVRSMLVRLIDYFKINTITAVFTSMTDNSILEVSGNEGVSSLMDTWILLRNIESDAERNRTLYVLKSRGIKHSAQVREFIMTDHGINLIDVSLGPAGVLVGSARAAYQAHEHALQIQRQTEAQRLTRELENKRQSIQHQIAALQAELAAEEERLQNNLSQADEIQRSNAAERKTLSEDRQDSNFTLE